MKFSLLKISLSRGSAAVFLLLAGAAAQAATYTPKTYIITVLASAPEMIVAQQALEQAKNGYVAAVLDVALPSFSANMNTSLYSDSDTSWRLDRNRVNNSLNASWNLYDSGSSPYSRIRAAKQDYRYAELSYVIARQDEALEALNRFYALYSAQKRIGTAKTDLTSREKQYADTKEQFESGTRSKIDITQSEGDKLQSELSLAQAESATAKALMRFNELINADPEAPQELEVSTQTVEMKLPLPSSDMARALDNNARLRQQKIKLERTRIDARTSAWSDLPRLKLDLSWNRSAYGLPGAFGGKNAEPVYGVNASLNFPFGFLGAQNYLNVKNQNLVVSSAEQDLKTFERSLKTKVLSAQKDIELQVKAQQLLEFSVKAQRSALESLQEEYSQGGANFLQLDLAQSKLLDSSNSQINAVNDLDLSLANYKTLLGQNIWE